MSLNMKDKTQVFCKGNDKKEMKEMKEKENNVLNDNINDRIAIVRSKERIIFLIGVVSIFFSSIISVYAANYLYSSSEVSFDNSSSGISSDNVQGAIDELYQNASDYSSLESRIGVLEGRWKNNPTSYFSDNGLVIGDGANNDSYVRLYDSNGKARADFVYGKTADTTYLVSRNSSEQWGQGKLDIKGNPVMVNGTSLNDWLVSQRITVTKTISTTATQVSFSATKSGYSPIAYTLINGQSTTLIGNLESINLSNGSISGFGYFKDTNGSKSVNFYIDVLWRKNL